MRYTSPIANTKQVPRFSAIAAFVVDVQYQQTHIAHVALFQRAGNSEGCNGIYYDGKKTQICRTWNGPVDQDDEHVALSNKLNFKRVVGCQVFWPLKLWFLVWQVLKTMTTKTVGFGKFAWPDNCDIDLGAIQVLRNAIFREIGPPPTPS